MDVIKELRKLKKERIVLYIIGIILSVIGFPCYILGIIGGMLYIITFGMFTGFVGLALILRASFHPNYYNLSGEIAGYMKCKQLHFLPPRGQNKELDELIKGLEDKSIKKGHTLFNSVASVDDNKLVKKTITDLGNIDKATDEALFKCYYSFWTQSRLVGLKKNKHAKIQMECVFRIIYLRNYQLLGK